MMFASYVNITCECIPDKLSDGKYQWRKTKAKAAIDGGGAIDDNLCCSGLGRDFPQTYLDEGK